MQERSPEHLIGVPPNGVVMAASMGTNFILTSSQSISTQSPTYSLSTRRHPSVEMVNWVISDVICIVTATVIGLFAGSGFVFAVLVSCRDASLRRRVGCTHFTD